MLWKHNAKIFSTMMPISSPLREPSLMSPRTAKYVEAMIRLGDSFDYDRWLKSVREEEAQAKQLSAGIRSGDVDPGTIEEPGRSI
jgi:hypothetical protein